MKNAADKFMVEGNLRGQLLLARGARGSVLVSRELAWSYAQEFAARGALVNVSRQGTIVWSTEPTNIGREQ